MTDHSISDNGDGVPDRWAANYLLEKSAPIPFPFTVARQLDDLKEKLRSVIESKEERHPYWEGTGGVLSYIALHNEYLAQGRYPDCLELSFWMYESALRHQVRCIDLANPVSSIKRARLHKGIFLYPIYQVYEKLGWDWHARRFLILALVENALTYFLLRNPGDPNFPEGISGPLRYYAERTGTYRTLHDQLGISDNQILDFVDKVGAVIEGVSLADWRKSRRKATEQDKHWEVPKAASPFRQLGRCETRGGRFWPSTFVLFPEWILGRLPAASWHRCDPSAAELNECRASRVYSTRLWDAIKAAMASNKDLQAVETGTAAQQESRERGSKSKGYEKPPAPVDKADFLEELAHYLLSCIPGFRTHLNVNTDRGEHDLLVIREGPSFDFREASSRHFLCECKCTKNRVGQRDLGHFLNKIRFVGANFGVLFAMNSVSGNGTYAHGAKQFGKDRDNVLIVVVDKKDFKDLLPKVDDSNVGQTVDALQMLKTKYEIERIGLFRDLSTEAWSI